MKYLLLTCLSIALFSCKKVDLSTMSSSFWSPKLAVPIAYGSFTINDILMQADSIDKYLGVTDERLIQLKVSQAINGFNLTEVVKLPDFNTLPEQSVYSFSNLGPTEITTINSIASLKIGKVVPFLDLLKSVNSTIEVNQKVPLDFSTGSSDLPSNFRIDRIDLSTGNLQVNVKKGLPYKTVLKFTFNEIKKDGKSLVDSIIYNPNSNQPMVINLAGCYADFSNKQLSFSIDAINITPEADLVNPKIAKPITSTDQIVLGVSLTKLGFKSVQGYFGNLSIPPISDTLKIDQFKDLKGKFGMSNPSIKLDIVNGFGIPVDLDFNKFNVVRKDNSLIPIGVKAFPIGYPLNVGDAAVPSSLEISKNKGVTNIDKLLSSETKEIQFGGSLTVNKAGETSVKNFITDKSSISLNAEITLPLTGYASGFTFSDTSNFTFPTDVLKSLEMHLLYTNTLPLDIDASITFLDQFDNPIKIGDQVFNLFSSNSGKLIKSPILKLYQTTQTWKLSKAELENLPPQTLVIKIKETDLPFLKNAKKIIFGGSFETFGGSQELPVTLYDYYGLSINLHANVKGGVSIKK